MNLFLLLTHFVYSYGYDTHEYLGNYLDNYMVKFEPKIYDSIISVLNTEGNGSGLDPFSQEQVTIKSVSIWADTMKKKKGYTWTRQLHYIDITECNKPILPIETIETYCEGKCIFSAIKEMVSIFKNGNGKGPIGNLSKNKLLKFIIHFIQDFNQPMHLLGYDQGGNGFDVIVKQHSGRNKSCNVHYLWDTLVPEFYIKNYNFTFTWGPEQSEGTGAKRPERSKATRSSGTEIKYRQEEIIDNFDLERLLLEILNINLKIACKMYPKNRFIVFDEYFDHKDLEVLFNNYVYMSLKIFRYLFNKNKILNFQN